MSWFQPLSPPLTHRDVGLGVLRHRDRIVDRAVHDLVAPFGEPVAHLVGVRRDLDVDRKTALGEEAFLLGGEEWKVLQSLEHHDGELGLALSLA